MQKVSSALIVWYKDNKRDLPWRETRDPYRIWVSEIILQQTRVNQGIEYYYRFLDLFPTVNHLAKASEDDVLKAWQGLGYYSRARNMHLAAKKIISEYNGIFPDRYSELLKLKGIGSYTAAAISSICFNEHQTVLDGNVYRVVSRLFGIYTPINTTKGKREFEEITHSLNDGLNSGEFNQAIMEYGALHCTPKNPKCDNCIFDSCYARTNNVIDKLPVKEKKLKIRNRFLNYFFVEDNEGNTLINKRKDNDIWKGLFDFPLIETDNVVDDKTLINDFSKLELYYDNVVFKDVYNCNHVLTHQKLNIKILHIKVNAILNENHFKAIKISDLQNKAFPKPLHQFIETKLL